MRPRAPLLRPIASQYIAMVAIGRGPKDLKIPDVLDRWYRGFWTGILVYCLEFISKKVYYNIVHLVFKFHIERELYKCMRLELSNTLQFGLLSTIFSPVTFQIIIWYLWTVIWNEQCITLELYVSFPQGPSLWWWPERRLDLVFSGFKLFLTDCVYKRLSSKKSSKRGVSWFKSGLSGERSEPLL